jgi:hypothetical protein
MVVPFITRDDLYVDAMEFPHSSGDPPTNLWVPHLRRRQSLGIEEFLDAPVAKRAEDTGSDSIDRREVMQGSEFMGTRNKRPGGGTVYSQKDRGWSYTAPLSDVRHEEDSVGKRPRNFTDFDAGRFEVRGGPMLDAEIVAQQIEKVRREA